MLVLASMLTGFLAVSFVFVSVLMMLVILIQRPKGGGLSGAFGGAGGSAQAAFGAKTGDFLTWTTVVFFVLFLGLAMGLTWSIRADVRAAQQSRQAPGMAVPAPPTEPAELPDAFGDLDATQPSATPGAESTEPAEPIEPPATAQEPASPPTEPSPDAQP